MRDKKIIDFVTKHRISVLTTMLLDGTPHSSTLHYSASFSSFYFIFMTDKESRKNQKLINSGSTPASLVIGFSEEEWVTLQMEGEVRILTKEDQLDEAWRVYSEKFKGSEKYKDLADSVLLKFVPKWWRYTELKPAPAKVISSEGKNES
ncbi:MAG TPA: pyridoxamine 5'-phosphate oxidase family protein [Patescibacteria group bacterium]|nr:pyridoxamine 5'-phosphate oxidase family protein [Patescibacteria group bacterium]